MELAMAATLAVFPKDDTNMYPLFVVSSAPMGAGAGIIASHIIKSVMQINPLVSAVYGGIACFTSALLFPIIDKVFENVIKNSTAGKLVKLTITTVVSFAVAFLTISLYGIKIPLATALLTAGTICAINMVFMFGISAQIASEN